MISNNISRPAVRYHGGKFLLADWIISHFPEHKVYTDTFGGGANVLLKKKRSYAEIYNDIDNEIVNLFTVLRDNGDELIKRITLTPYSRAEFELSYQDATCPVEQARRTMIRSFMGFASGLHAWQKTGFRANSNRSGTTPAHDWTNLPSAMPHIINRLRGIVIENRDYREILKQHDHFESLHYFDPPYVLSTRFKGERTKVYKHEFNNQDHVDLCEYIIGLKGMSIVSGYDNDIYRDILRGWRIVFKQSFADGAKSRKECLFISPNTPLLQTQLFN